MNPFLQALLSASSPGAAWAGSQNSGLPAQQPTPFSQSPPASALARAFKFITAAPASAAPSSGPANTDTLQPLGKASALIPSLMAGSGASTATPQNNAGTAPVASPTVPLPQPRPPTAGAPMNIAPQASQAQPNPTLYNPMGGAGSVSGSAMGGAPNGMQGAPGGVNLSNFVNAMRSQQLPQGTVQNGQQPQGLLPRMASDFSMMKKLFSGGPSGANPFNTTGSLY